MYARAIMTTQVTMSIADKCAACEILFTSSLYIASRPANHFFQSLCSQFVDEKLGCGFVFFGLHQLRYHQIAFVAY